MSETGICRWGILGTATISRKTWKAICNAENARLVAVASRNRPRCEEFIANCQSQIAHTPIPTAYDNYEGLIGSKDIDAVYIPLPTGLRKKWVELAAKSGKHVLCEKPCAINADDLKEMIDVCAQNNVQFMDNVMYMHSGRLGQLRKVMQADDGIGDLRRIATQFSFNAPDEFFADNIRTSSELEPQGCLGDLGWYTIRFCLWAMNYELPTHLSATMHSELKRSDSPASVPVEVSCNMQFENGVSASFYCSFRTHHQQWANISGSQGYIHVQDYVLPFFGAEVGFELINALFTEEGCDFNMEKRARRFSINEFSNSNKCAQETNLIRTFSKLVTTNKIDKHWPEISLKTQLVLDACMESATNGGKKVQISAT